MKEYIIRLSVNKRPFREIFIEAENEEVALQLLNNEHTRWEENLNSNKNLTSNLYEIKWINGI